MKSGGGLRNYSIGIKVMDFDHTIWVIIQAAILARQVTLGKLVKMAKSQEIFYLKKRRSKITNS